MNARTSLALGAALLCLAAACALRGPVDAERHRWWTGLGPVLSHDTFPADCKLCHVGEAWNELAKDFRFDHEAEAGVALEGAHRDAQCLLCHNDRGPVGLFQARGCAGCHEDVHFGELGQRCDSCHDVWSWRPTGQSARHHHTRFPLSGAHARVACHRCHPGALAGDFLPTETACVSCHRDDLLATQNPPHVPLGWVDGCQRCHPPTSWSHAEIDR